VKFGQTSAMAGSASVPSSKRIEVSPKLIVTGVVAALALVFVLQNTRKGRLSFLFFDFTAPGWIFFLLVLLVGAVIGFIGRGIWSDRRAKQS
jgi:uncharacterized integral membrane protein